MRVHRTNRGKDMVPNMKFPWSPKPTDPRTGQKTRGLSWCRRCGTTWDRVEGRTVSMSDTGGTFAICEGCWDETDVHQRLVYYLHVWAEQHFDHLGKQEQRELHFYHGSVSPETVIEAVRRDSEA